MVPTARFLITIDERHFWRGCGLAFFCFWPGSAQGRAAAVLFSLSDDEKSSIRALRLLTEVTLFSNLMPRSSRLYAGVAQLVEQRIRNAKVAGSTPVSGTSQFKPVALIPLFSSFCGTDLAQQRSRQILARNLKMTCSSSSLAYLLSFLPTLSITCLVDNLNILNIRCLLPF